MHSVIAIDRVKRGSEHSNLGRKCFCSGDVGLIGIVYSDACFSVRASGLPSAVCFSGCGFGAAGTLEHHTHKTEHRQRNAPVLHRSQCLVISNNTQKHELGERKNTHRYSTVVCTDVLLCCMNARGASRRSRSKSCKIHRCRTRYGDTAREAAQHPPPLAEKSTWTIPHSSGNQAHNVRAKRA